MRLFFALFAVVAIYSCPAFFSQMSHAYLVEAAIKSGFIVAVCDYCRRDYKELALIIAIEFCLCIVCAIIALRWQPGMISAEVLITDIFNAAFVLEMIIISTLGVQIVRRKDFSITFDRRRDDVHRDNLMEVAL